MGKEFVRIEDRNLLENINRCLGRGDSNFNPVTQDDMEKLIRLSANSSEIKSIKGLEHAVNLEYLELRINKIKDIEFIEKLTKLELLDLSFNEIRDISPLEKLDRLESVHLAENKIKDISPLKKLQHLGVLSLSSNEIKDMSPLKSMRSDEIFMYADKQKIRISNFEKIKIRDKNNKLIKQIVPVKDVRYNGNRLDEVTIATFKSDKYHFFNGEIILSLKQ